MQTKQDSAGIVVVVIGLLLNDLIQLLLIKSKWSCWSDHIPDISYRPYPNSTEYSRKSVGFAAFRQAAVSFYIPEMSNCREKKKQKQIRNTSMQLPWFSGGCLCHLKKQKTIFWVMFLNSFMFLMVQPETVYSSCWFFS